MVAGQNIFFPTNWHIWVASRRWDIRIWKDLLENVTNRDDVVCNGYPWSRDGIFFGFFFWPGMNFFYCENSEFGLFEPGMFGSEPDFGQDVWFTYTVWSDIVCGWDGIFQKETSFSSVSEIAPFQFSRGPPKIDYSWWYSSQHIEAWPTVNTSDRRKMKTFDLSILFDTILC